VLAFTVAVSILTTLLVGTAPALRATHVNVHTTLSEGGRGGTAGRAATRLGSALIVTEIALAVILVTGAGLLGRTFATLMSWRPGFEQQHLLTAWALASSGKYEKRQQIVALFSRAEDELRTLPSVVSVGSGSAGPLFGGDGDGLFTIDGRTPATGAPRQAAFWFDISPSYFRTIGLPIVRGRDVTDHDGEGTPFVAVVNETLERRRITSASAERSAGTVSLTRRAISALSTVSARPFGAPSSTRCSNKSPGGVGSRKRQSHWRIPTCVGRPCWSRRRTLGPRLRSDERRLTTARPPIATQSTDPPGAQVRRPRASQTAGRERPIPRPEPGRSSDTGCRPSH